MFLRRREKKILADKSEYLILNKISQISKSVLVLKIPYPSTVSSLISLCTCLAVMMTNKCQTLYFALNQISTRVGMINQTVLYTSSKLCNSLCVPWRVVQQWAVECSFVYKSSLTSFMIFICLQNSYEQFKVV